MTNWARMGVGAVAAIALSSGYAAAETWDMPVAYADGNFHTENAKAFAQCVDTGTGGALDIVVHASGSLFKGNEIKRAVQTGQAPVGERLLSAHENENPLFGIDSIPFLATSYEDSEKLWKAARPTLEKVLDEQNLVLLYSVPWPPQGIYTKNPVNSAKDMEGVKFRSYNSATARMAELLGAVPVQVEAAELSQALATGVAESFISSGSTGYDRKVWEQLNYWYEVNAWLPRNYVFANKDAWEALGEPTRNVVTACADFAGHAGTVDSQRLNDWYKAELQANGMTVEPASDQLRSDLEAIGKTMTEEWFEAAGDEGRAVVDAYENQ
ncbi:MAG: TRAP transporter substrate-binding protein [Geminicoccaceae bacterium]|nr:TRAP transporter substrate-binding protein [Geminicoccaceae bacterium]MCB9942602.1 TRAP transporter substrate-binding protein [Geminicoccaceae bacterium]